MMKTLVLLQSVALASLLLPSPALAQSSQAPASANPEAPGTADKAEIIVTARGRQERLQDVPLSVSALSSDTLQKLDVKNTNQLTNYVPSVQFSNTTSGYFGGRLATRPIVIRGLNLANSYGVNSAALIFLDGAPVLGAELAPGLDYERVEVLRGPQSVQFGRSTLSGAINYVTKDIGNAWHGDLEANLGSYATRGFIASVSGPLTDRFKIGLSGAIDSNHGYYKNGLADSGQLGATNTKSVSARIQWEPTDAITIKGYVNYFTDDDGASATAQVSAYQDNCTLGGARGYYCGAFPGVRSEGVYTDTHVPASAAGFIFNGFNSDGGRRWDAHLGSQREAALGHIIASWKIGDFAELRSLSAYEWDASMGANNGKLKPAAASDAYDHYLFSANFLSRNFSQEVRLSSVGHKRFRWTLGASYVDGESDQQFLVDYRLNTPGAQEVNFDTHVQYDKTRSYGIFGGVYYDILDPLTLSVEARYQWDRRTGIPQQAVIDPANTLSATFRSFSPRVALDYKVSPDLTTYVSFSRGTRPGGFNLRIPQYLNNPSVIADLTSQLGPFGLTYKEEKLTNYEIGIKGSALDRRANFALDFYYGNLTNQQILNSAYISSINNTLELTNNIGKTEVYGVEFDGSFRASRSLTLSGSFAWNHNAIKRYLCTSCVVYTGSTDVSGHSLEGSPQFSGSLAADYTHALGATGWNGFGHVDYVYRGAMHIDIFSDQKVAARNLINLRAGVTKDHLTFEAYVENVTDNRSYDSYTVGNDYAAGRFSAFSFNLPQPRTFGGRAIFRF